MTVYMWTELALILAATLALAYLAAEIDAYLIARRASKLAEHKRIVDILKRK